MTSNTELPTPNIERRILVPEILRLLARSAEVAEQYTALLEGPEPFGPDHLALSHELEEIDERLYSIPAAVLLELAEQVEVALL